MPGVCALWVASAICPQATPGSAWGACARLTATSGHPQVYGMQQGGQQHHFGVSWSSTTAVALTLSLTLPIALQDLYVAVTKATLPDEVVPKEKHVRSEWQQQGWCACARVEGEGLHRWPAPAR